MSYARFAQTVAPLSYKPPPRKSDGPWGKPHHLKARAKWLCYPERPSDDPDIIFGYMVNTETGRRMDGVAWYINDLSLEPFS